MKPLLGKFVEVGAERAPEPNIRMQPVFRVNEVRAAELPRLKPQPRPQPQRKLQPEPQSQPESGVWCYSGEAAPSAESGAVLFLGVTLRAP